VQRYQSTAAIGSAASNYLNTQFLLSLLNYLDPNIAGFDSFTFGGEHPFRANAFVRHEPTFFGSDTQLHVLFQRGDLGLEGELHSYLDRAYDWHPGLSAELVRYPLRFGQSVIPHLTFHADLWRQPTTRDLLSTGGGDVGGLVRMRLTYPVVGPLEVWLEGMGKTPGWAPGEVSLQPDLAVRAGVSAGLFR
jgi:hypothetical protein